VTAAKVLFRFVQLNFRSAKRERERERERERGRGRERERERNSSFYFAMRASIYSRREQGIGID